MTLSKMIEKFLAEKRESSAGGGYAEITDQDTEDLYAIVHALIEKKCEADADGDYPIQVNLVNRRLHEPLHWMPVPYGHKDPRGFIEAAMANVQIAVDRMRLVSFEMRELLKEKEA